MAVPKVCFVADVCRELRISRRTLVRLRAANLLPIVELPRIGHRLRFSGESVAALQRSRWVPRDLQEASWAS